MEPTGTPQQQHAGRVAALNGDRAVIRFERGAMCKSCGACVSFGDGMMELNVRNACDAKPGELVVVAIAQKRALQAGLLAYAVPLAALLGGLLIGSLYSELLSVALGLGLCAASFGLIRLLDRRFSRMKTFEPQMIRIIHEEE